MGNCCRLNNSNKEFNNQIIFNESMISEKESEEKNSTKLKTNNRYNNFIETADNSLNLNFKRIIKEQAKIISPKEFDNIITSQYPHLNRIPFPENRMPSNAKNIFSSQPIKFSTGEIYMGSWNSKNQRHGFGIGINPDGTLFKGLWKGDKVGNFGIFMEKNGDYYMGELKDGKFEGKGELEIQGSFRYTGEFKNVVIDGRGKMENYENECLYDGDWKEGVETGTGILEFSDGTKYEGEFKNGLYHGNGMITFSNGDKFEGEFVEGCIKGKGKYTWNDGEKYDGEYEDFMKNGFGKFYWNNDKYYEGMWLNNKQHGNGIIHYDDKEISGMFRFGKIIKGN